MSQRVTRAKRALQSSTLGGEQRLTSDDDRCASRKTRPRSSPHRTCRKTRQRVGELESSEEEIKPGSHRRRVSELESSDESAVSSVDIEGSLRGPLMFDGLTAWFSASVDQQRKHKWIEQDGQKDPLETAMYLFSDDASSDDTNRIYHSEDYLKDSLSVFHSSFIDECLETGNVKDVTLGKYFLPPAAIQDAIKHRTRFQWETRAGQAECRKKGRGGSRNQASPQKNMADSRVDHRSSIPQTSKSTVSSDLPHKRASDSASSPRKHTSRSALEASTNGDRSTRKINIEAQSSGQSQAARLKDKTVHSSSTQVPTSTSRKRQDQSSGGIDLTGYLPVSSLKLAAGYIRDFIAGEEKCNVFFK